MSRDRLEPEALLARLTGPADPELSCEECFEALDRYVELELAGAEADAIVAGMAAHLQGCPACREDHESLRALVLDDDAVARRRGPEPST